MDAALVMSTASLAVAGAALAVAWAAWKRPGQLQPGSTDPLHRPREALWSGTFGTLVPDEPDVEPLTPEEVTRLITEERHANGYVGPLE
jgi:hypothetical protein